MGGGMVKKRKQRLLFKKIDKNGVRCGNKEKRLLKRNKTRIMQRDGKEEKTKVAVEKKDKN